MVFEAIVVDLLNKFLNQYIENLDTSQLKIGIWGGDVVLADLIIKQTIFKDWNLPFKVAYGKLGKLSLKIPWKNLYGDSTSAIIENLFILFVPNTEIEYDADKEEKWIQEKKQYQLKLVDEAKKRELEKDKPETPDTFMEKLTMQIIKNIQVEIRNIHIRYEDKTTDQSSPFSIGATISTLSLRSMTSDPFPLQCEKPRKSIEFIYKMINLEGLSIYWNPDDELLAPLKPSEMEAILLKNIPTHNFKPENYKYVFGPIVAKGSLRLNPKPESDGTNYATPKVFILVDLEEIKLAVSRKQFRNITLFLQNLQRLTTASRYRKYRPFGIPVLGHVKKWWQFAYAAVTEDIKRRKIEWSWDHIKTHREMCRKYEDLFRMKSKTKKIPKAVEKELEELEKKLNIFDLILLREKVYVEVERLAIEESENKASSGWFSYFFSSGHAKADDSEKDDLVTKLEKVMTAKEKEKLYKAIDYQENFNTTIYPDYFVEFKFLFKLKALRLNVYDDKIKSKWNPTVLTVSLNDVNLLFEKRPSANAIKLTVSLGDFIVLGKASPGEAPPEIVKSNFKRNEQLVDVLLETNPLDGYCDQRIHVHANALFIIYNAPTLNILQDIFNPPTEEKVATIMATTAASLPTFQEITALGLQYAISRSSRLEVRVHILASNLILPYNGIYNPDNEFLIVKLGQFDVTTEERTGRDISIKKLHLQGSSDKDIFSIVLSASYRKFKCQLEGIQILYRMAGEEWMNVLESAEQSPLRLLEPTNLTITIKKCLVTDDPRIPKAVIEGSLPSITINISEDRVICLAGLMCSIPTSLQEPETIVMNRRLTSSTWSLQSFGTQFETKLRQKMIQKESEIVNQEFVQGIDLVAHFEMNELVVFLSKTKGTETNLSKNSLKPKAPTPGTMEEKFLQFSILSLNCELTCKTFETLAEVKLGAIEVRQNHMNTFIPIVATKGQEGEDNYLFLAEYCTVDKKVPDFFTKRNGIVTMLKLNFTTLDVILHKEALIEKIAFVKLLQNRLEEVKASGASKVGDTMTRKMVSIFEDGMDATSSEKKIVARGKKFRKKKNAPDVVDLVVDLNMDSLNVNIRCALRELSSVSVVGGKVEFSSRKVRMDIDCKLNDVIVLDLDPNTVHKKIVSSVDHHTISLKTTIFNEEYLETNKSVNISVYAEVGRVRLVFLNRFMNSALVFLSAFQNESAAIKEGATAAAQRAKEGVIKAYENETKISLNVKIMAPLIVFPVRSSSLEVILMDMGTLNIKSFITELEDVTIPDGGELNMPLMDVIKCHLENIKLTRATLIGERDMVAKEKSILEPVTFELTVNRNLSATWYTDTVPLEIQGRLEIIHVTLAHSDLCFMVNALQENFAEGYAELSRDKDVVATTLETASGDESLENSNTNLKPFGDDEKGSDQNLKPSVIFSFLANRFVFDNANDVTSGKAERRDPVSLARFELEVFSLKGTIFSNGSISTSAYLSNVTIDDTRPGKPGRITNLMGKKPDESYTKESGKNDPAMLNINFQKKDMDSFVDIRVYGFNLILSMDFISKLLMFFKIDDPACTQSSIQVQAKQNEVKRIGSSGKNVKAVSVGKTREKRDDTEEVDRLPTFTVNIRLEKPDIIIVESIDSPDTEALVFNSELLMKYRCAGSRQVITGTLSDIGLFSCAFNSLKRSQTLSQIIKPFTISMAGSTPENQGLHVDICLTDIHVSINTETIALINKCQATLLSDFSRDESTEVFADYSDLWSVKNFVDDDYWFLKTEEGVDALLTLSKPSANRSPGKKHLEEICLLSIPSVVITVEGMSGKSRMPLVLFEMSLQGQILNWSSQLVIDAVIKMQMQYFNKSLSAWEPLIEPTEVVRDRKSCFVPWELDCNIIFGNDNEADSLSLDEEQPSSPSINATLSCSKNLEITITKSCLEVFQNLSDAFTSAVTHSQTKSIVYPPFVVKNETGVVVELLLEQSGLQLNGVSNQEYYKIVKLESGGEVELEEDKRRHRSASKAKKIFIEEKKELYLHIKSPSFEDVLELPISRTSKRYYPVNNSSSDRESWGLISDVNLSQNSDVITLRSILQIRNCFQEAIDVHQRLNNSRDLKFIGTVEGNSVLNIPFHSVYSPTKELFFNVKGCTLSTTPLSWNDIKGELSLSVLLRCNPENIEDSDPFFIMAIGEIEHVYFENTYRYTISSMCINIHLQPTFQLLNCLPVDLIVCTQGCATEKLLSSAERLQITNAEPGVSAITLRIENYLDKEWSCKETIPVQPVELTVWTFVSYCGLASETMNVGVLHSTRRSSSILTIYCPYLMVNRTGLVLSYRFDDNNSTVFHPATHKKPLMFSPGAKKFFSRKKALMKVNHGEWSDKFPVDVAGSGGTIECYDPIANCRYLIAVTITLTFNNLSKIVLLSPYYVILNKTMYNIQCQECLTDQDPWITIESGECAPIWPLSEEKAKTIQLRIEGTDEVTAPFYYDSTDSVLLMLNNKCGGLFVDIQTTNSGTNIVVYPYETGLAPALLLNHTQETLRLSEKGHNNSIILKPREKLLYAWVKPTEERKLLILEKNKEHVFNLKEDVNGTVNIGPVEVSYVSFLDGTQRVLLFTEDAEAVSEEKLAGRYESSGMEVILKIHGIGISLVNNISQVEILYMGFVSSGISWEARKEGRSRFKPLSTKDSYAMENAYKKFEENSNIDSNTDAVVVIDNRIQVNFETMEMLYPHKRKIKRVFEPGLWAAYRAGKNFITFHMKINRIQIDNQLQDSIFPVVLFPMLPPKTVAISHGPKPFFELSMLKVSVGQSRVQQYKYFRILVQEFSVKIDIGFITQCWTFLTADEVTDEEYRAKFKRDLVYCEEPLLSHVMVSSTNEQKNFYDLLHFSPLKVHFSFSLAGNIESSLMPPSLSVLLQSLGVTLTDLHDVLFRLSYFERKSAFLTHSQLRSEVSRHYYGQAIRQAYVLLLGLDVIGNPFGLVIGIGQGVEAFFYEPVQGIIQGPSDFATGVALGCRSLFGHTVGGTAGTLGRITGTLGKGLAVLSLDKEYQRERMEQQNRRTDNISATMAQGGRGVVMGVYEGVTGVVMKPISGAKEEGIGGFFKGVGKGMMGLVTRPVTGVIDFASTSLNAVKRVAEQNVECKRLRSPRFFQDDKLVLPYKKHEAQGNSILYEIEKRKYCKTDKYEYHTELRGKEILLLTDKRMLLIEYSDVFGNWQVHLDITWLEMSSPPKEHPKGVAINIPRKKSNLFQNYKDVKILAVDDILVRQLLFEKMVDLYYLESRSGV